MAKKTIKAKGKKFLTFNEGGEHQSLGIPAGKPIPASKHEAAARGDYGAKAKRQEQFRRNVLTGPKMS